MGAPSNAEALVPAYRTLRLHATHESHLYTPRVVSTDETPTDPTLSSACGCSDAKKRLSDHVDVLSCVFVLSIAAVTLMGVVDVRSDRRPPRAPFCITTVGRVPTIRLPVVHLC